MEIREGILVPLGYGKYVRSDAVVALVPIEENRGPGRRTLVYIEGHTTPLVASRSEESIVRDLVQSPQDITRAQQQREVLRDLLEDLAGIEPVLRRIIREQGHFDLDRAERRIREVLEEQEVLFPAD
ncbi:MAG TPA: hypothetical protein EYP85_15880 [Armatimonadetes bacterium]|nr:hypothetical protein [Armatimonadota bacterium]